MSPEENQETGRGEIAHEAPGLPERGAVRVAWRTRQDARSPLEVFRLLQAERAHLAPAFLYSGEGYSPLGRYSIIPFAPRAAISAWPDSPGDPLELLAEALGRWSWRGDVRPPIPFFGGWVGYLSYDLAHQVERLRTAARVEHGFPLLEFAFYPRALCYDHQQENWTACQLLGEDASEEAAEEQEDRLLDWALTAPAPPVDDTPALSGALTSNFSQADYEQAVRRILAYIVAGDCYQVNLSQRFTAQLAISPAELARRLFEASPAPFSAYLAFGPRAIVSSSPERFLQLRDDEVEARPIKGTRPRGQTPAEDERLRAELLASEKERAELTMITDLLRNDLGRVCEYGTVRVAELRSVASLPNVHHTYSRVVGRLRPDAGPADLLRATLPGGSITGAPKVRAMEIIEELEPTARGPYCGAIGHCGVDGNIDLNIAIRTILCEGRQLSFQVGGGIVADSQPREEYEETLHKAQGILKALGAPERE